MGQRWDSRMSEVGRTLFVTSFAKRPKGRVDPFRPDTSAHNLLIHFYIGKKLYHNKLVDGFIRMMSSSYLERDSFFFLLPGESRKVVIETAVSDLPAF